MSTDGTHELTVSKEAAPKDTVSNGTVSNGAAPENTAPKDRAKQDEIKSAIPHRGPMLLVDEVVSKEETNIVCRKTFHGDEFFLQGHFPDRPVVPGVILCESAMQSGAIMLAGDVPREPQAGIPVATRLNNVKFRKMVLPGDTVELHVELVEQVGNAYFMKARVVRDDVMVMRCEFACSIAKF